MYITSETPDARICENVAWTRRNLSDFASQCNRESAEDPTEFSLWGGRLVGMAQEVHNAEALCQLQMCYRDICRDAPQDRIYFLTDILVQGPEDTWSSSKNDSAQEAFDGIRRWVEEQIDNVRYEEK